MRKRKKKVLKNDDARIDSFSHVHFEIRVSPIAEITVKLRLHRDVR